MILYVYVFVRACKWNASGVEKALESVAAEPSLWPLKRDFLTLYLGFCHVITSRTEHFLC